MGIEERFEIAPIGALALREKQIQQNDRNALPRLVLAELSDRPLAETFFRGNDSPSRFHRPLHGRRHAADRGQPRLMARFGKRGGV
jgi:hypothetical protein